MPVPDSIDDLLELVRKSGLVEPDRLDAFVGRVAIEAGAAEPRRWAAMLVGAGLLTHFQAEQLLLGKWRGFTIGKYRVLERLGFGGTGTVYLCEHQVVRRKVAVKVLPATKADNPAALGRFYREARAAGVLDHPNLVKAHDIDQEGALHFLVMDYVDGANLQEIVGKFGPLSPARAAHYVRQASQGLQAAHQAGLVHRDIKPANILLDRSGTVRVLDLGLARFFRDDEDLLTLKYDEMNVLGTADYVSPEQALNSHEVDIRADIYSLGATFYFLLTGQPPFPGGKAAQKLIWHQVRQPTPVRQLRPEVPEGMSAVAARMLAKDPAERFQTPADVAAALAPWTREPLPPPSAEEMPQLCPAASRSVSMPDYDPGPQTPFSSSRPPTLHPSSSKPAWEVDSCYVPLLVQQPPQRQLSMAELATPRTIGSQVTATDRPRPSRPVPIASAPTVSTPGKTAMKSPQGVLPRPTSASATAQPRPAAQTTPATQAEPKVKPAAPPSKARSTLGLMLILGIGASLGVGLKFGLALLKKSERPAGVAALLFVDRTGVAGTYPSVAAALAKAQPGDHVRVRMEVLEEALDLARTDGAAQDVVIEADPDLGRPVVWRAPAGHAEAQPLVTIGDQPGLQFHGFKLDGQDRVGDLIVLSGACPGLTLEDLTLTGYTEAAVKMVACSGSDDRPVTLRRLRAAPTQASQTALSFEAGAHELCRRIQVADCRFEGPSPCGVAFHGPADVAFEHNRFFGLADGVVYHKTDAAALTLTMAHNTFCDIEKAALRFETAPPLETSRVTLNSNLFARTRTLATIDDFRTEPSEVKAKWIRFDEPRVVEATTHYRSFRKSFTVEGAPGEAMLSVAADAGYSAWVNGAKIGHGDFAATGGRVQAYDVSRFLKTGANAVAVQASSGGGPAGVLVQLTYTRADGTAAVVATDGSWRSSRSSATGWQKPGFDDSHWAAAKEEAAYGQGPASWRHLTWDVAVQERFGGRVSELFPSPTGNVRDLVSREGFPQLDATSLNFELPTDPSDDARFLRYLKASLLGLMPEPPGVPPLEKRREPGVR